MDGRAFLRSARQLLKVSAEENWRSAASRAYYALLHEGDAALRRWGIVKPPGQGIHDFVRKRYGAPHADLRPVRDALDALSRLRNAADYLIDQPGRFVNDGEATRGVTRAEAAITHLDQIEADPARRTAVIAAIRAAFP
jgi:hypothetical protein